MPFFSNIFKSKDSAAKKNARENGIASMEPQKPRRWEDAWQRKDVEPEEVQDLLRGITHEIKSRALDMPFLLLPFRPASDPSAARSFIRNFFNSTADKGYPMGGDRLTQELRLIEPLVLCSVMKWCWSRLTGGVVTWEAYELFKIGEQDSNTARDAFATFIPISVASDARTKIIFDFFDIMAAIAAHGKTNGLGGRKLSRLAGWWAFDQAYDGNGFDGGYKSWNSAAEATSHLFFAYLRSLSPDSVAGKNGISALPLSLQALVHNTEYPPRQQPQMSHPTSRVVMIVDTVSPTPFALLRRAKHFEYRDEDAALQQFSDYEDPVQALTDECRRVLKSISSANDSSTTKTSTSLGNASWSRFEDMGFGGMGDDSDHDDEADGSALAYRRMAPSGLRTNPSSRVTNMGRPTTPSWADFLSSGFVDESKQGAGHLLLPPDKVLPPINTRGQSSQSHRRMTDNESILEPGELASINRFNLDDSFWWVWMSSLAGEETIERKSVFGRCALIETALRGGNWLLLEEIVKGAAAEPGEGAYIAEKKSRFGFSKRSRLNRSKSNGKKSLNKYEPVQRHNQSTTQSKASIAPDQHARIQAAAAALQQKQAMQDVGEVSSLRRGRQGDGMSTKTNSVFTLQPVIMSEAASAMKWANSYDKNTIRAQYLGDNFAGRGSTQDLSDKRTQPTDRLPVTNGSTAPRAPPKDIMPPPREATGYSKQDPRLLEVMQQGPSDSVRPSLPRERSQISNNRHSIAEEDGPSTPFMMAENIQPRNEVATEVPLPVATPIEYPQRQESKPLPHPGVSEYPQRMESKPLPPPVGAEDRNALPSAPTRYPQRTESKQLPPVGPGEYPQSADRYNSGPVQQIERPVTPIDPNVFAPGPEYSQHTSPKPAPVEPPSPETIKAGHKKLKKKSGQNGIKGFFGRKKTEERPKAPISPSTSAVAAARYALEAKQHEAQTKTAIAPKEVKAGRRISGFGRKEIAPPAAPLAAPPMPPVEERPDSFADVTPTPSRNQSRAEYENPRPGYDESRTSLSRVDTNEQLHADREFRTFDQGPLDAPAFVPDDSARGSVITDDGAVQVPEEHEIREHVQPSEDNDEARPISPVQDRWAQIRKNAAERAARLSEEQARQPVGMAGTDDGETSGEETIESRVARIKARVAELTGNMEAPGETRR